jgi:hypothetical protein
MRDRGLSPAAQSEVHDGAARLEALEIGCHRRPADRIDDDIDPIPPGPAADCRAHIGLSIANDLIGANRARKSGLFIGTDGRDYVSA